MLVNMVVKQAYIFIYDQMINKKKQKRFIYNFNTDYLKADASNWPG